MHFNQHNKIKRCTIGNEESPILIIDDFSSAPEQLIKMASDDSTKFQEQAADFYPGIRKLAPSSYSEQLSLLLLPLLKSINKSTLCKSIVNNSTLRNKNITTAVTKLSTFAITTTPIAQLRPIQMVPHFDSTADNQYAVIHYLCASKFGGTSFYRHKETAYERITAEKLTHYGAILKQQAMAEKLHDNPHYISQSTGLFEQLLSVQARMNRAVIYPSNLLHSGDINTVLGLSRDPRQGRLTISSLIVVN
jgi:hypothetical protein